MRSFSLLLVRHARVQVPHGVCYGRMDVALRPGWERIVSGLSVLARGVEGRVVHTSPAQRCVEMAKRLAAATGMELQVDERLAELDFGQWEGRHWQEIDRVALDDWAASPERFAPPGGESGQALRHRVRAFWRDVCHAGKAACVVSHGGPLRVLTALAEGRGPDLLRPSMPQGSARLWEISQDASLQEQADASGRSEPVTGSVI